MKYTITECSTVETFNAIETGQLFIRKDETDNALYLKGKRQNEDLYIDLETGNIFPITAFDSKGEDLVFHIADYNFECYLQMEV